jgi:hypothetical protein
MPDSDNLPNDGDVQDAVVPDANVSVDTKTDDEPGTTPNDNKEDKKTFDTTVDEVAHLKKRMAELSAENKKYRQKASQSSKESLEAKKMSEDALKKTEELHAKYEKRLIQVELRNLADKEGLIDEDAFKMVDISSIKIAENGSVVGATELVAELKKNKPYIFRSISSSSTDTKPDADINVQKSDAMQMTDAEYIKSQPASWRRGVIINKS